MGSHLNVTAAESAPGRDWTVFSAQCPSRGSLARIANKWTAMIVITLAASPTRFGELRTACEGISNKVLAETLHSLERDGLVCREEGPEPQRWALTDLGRTLHEPLTALRVWAEAHVEEVLGAQDAYDRAEEDRILGDA